LRLLIIADERRTETLFTWQPEWAILAAVDSASNPASSKDRRYIYFDIPTVENPVIYRIGPVDHKVERIANLKGFRRVKAFFPTMNLTPDGSPVLLRNTASGASQCDLLVRSWGSVHRARCQIAWLKDSSRLVVRVRITDSKPR
jgi:hypothetical protein